MDLVFLHDFSLAPSRLCNHFKPHSSAPFEQHLITPTSTATRCVVLARCTVSGPGMHLITTSPDGGLCLKEFVGNSIPPYAILSHTWGPDDQEVTYRDLNSQVHTTASAPYFPSRYMQKPGYRKLEFCVNRAAQDGLQYSWVDTCCIDKSSSVELSEAINSMFRWYREAAVCYVYLADVSSPRARAISSSRWFTRGWTLQELLAPTHLQFFTVDGTLIGDKNSSPDYLHQITRIPVSALNRNKSLLEFSVEERLSWAQGRETKREEDMAYCLLGLFDVHMPLIYGEGRKKASNRLMKEIKAMEDDEKQLAANTTPKLLRQSSFDGHRAPTSPGWRELLVNDISNGTSMQPAPPPPPPIMSSYRRPNTYTGPPPPRPLHPLREFSLERRASIPPASDPFMSPAGIYYSNAWSHHQQPHLSPDPYNGPPVPVARSRSMIHGSRSSYYEDEKVSHLLRKPQLK